VARLGGDEFVLLIAGGGDRASLETRAKAVRAAIVEPILLEGGQVVLDCSIGISVHPDDGASAEALIAHADRAMYQFKRARQQA
jgi:diguanylate cyclase (GGDEF)-like protein